MDYKQGLAIGGSFVAVYLVYQTNPKAAALLAVIIGFLLFRQFQKG